MINLLCPFCTTIMEESLENGKYGCDTGCEYVQFELTCPDCGKEIWRTGDFGEFENDAEREEYRQEFIEQWKEAVKRITSDADL